MKFLFCPLATPGFVYPAIGLALEMVRRGHEVAFVTDVSFTPILESVGLRRIVFGSRDVASFSISQWTISRDIKKQIRHIEYGIVDFTPDVLISCQLCMGALLAGEIHNLPVGIIGLMSYLWPTVESSGNSEKAKRLEWRFSEMKKIYDEACRALKLPIRKMSYRDTPLLGDLFLLQNVPELVENVDDMPGRVHCVGSCLWEPDFADDTLDDWLENTNPHYSTVYIQVAAHWNDPSFFLSFLDSVKDQPIKIAASIGRLRGDQYSMDMANGLVEKLALSENFFIRDFVPQGAVLAKARAVVANGNTTVSLAALVNGLPLLLLPRGGENVEIAEVCDRARAAYVVLNNKNIGDYDLLELLLKLLDDDVVRQGAQRAQHLFASSVKKGKAADLLEQLGLKKEPITRYGLSE